MKQWTVAVAAAGVLVAVLATALQGAGRDVVVPNVVAGALASVALTAALVVMIRRTTGRGPVAAVVVTPVVLVAVVAWGEWAASVGAWIPPHFLVYLAGIVVTAVTGWRRWPWGQLALYGLLTIVAYAAGALSGIVWGTIGDLTRTDELPFVAAVLALPALILATATAPTLRWYARIGASAALTVPVVAAFLLQGEAIRMVVGASSAALWVAGLTVRNVPGTPVSETPRVG